MVHSVISLATLANILSFLVCTIFLSWLRELATDTYEVWIRELLAQLLCSYSHVAKELTRGATTTLTNA